MFTKAITNVCVWLMCYTSKASHYKSQQNIESAYREVRHCCFLRGKIFDENLNSKRLWSNFMFYLLTKISSILRFLVFHNCLIETNYQICEHWLLFQKNWFDVCVRSDILKSRENDWRNWYSMKVNMAVRAVKRAEVEHPHGMFKWA